MKQNPLVTKWQDLLEAEGVPAIVTAGKQKIVARILEEQEKDLINAGIMSADWMDINEAEISGDAGGNATNIASGQNSGNVVYHGPTVMGLVRRAVPQMMAFDTLGVQPLTQPTGQVFVVRSVYGSNANLIGANGENEAFKPGKQPRVGHSGSGYLDGTAIAVGNGAHTALVGGDAVSVDKAVVGNVGGTSRFFKIVSTTIAGVAVIASTTVLDDMAKVNAAAAAGEILEIGEGLATSIAEVMQGFNGNALGDDPWAEMSFRIDKQGVEAKSRQLKAQYSIELAQDLRAVHGLDADTELSNLLANEIMVELNREVVNLINLQAQIGKSGKTRVTGAGTADGVFNFQNTYDVRGARWAGESYKALLIQIEKEANEIGRQTGRGNGNWILASRNVVSALSMTDTFVSYAAQGMQNGSMNTDTNASVFAGILGGRFRVFIDQYAVDDYVVVGYKGATEMDAGLYYSPYVPLTPLRGQDPKNMQPVLAFKTRYALSINPFVVPGNTQIFADSLARGMTQNQYFRRFIVTGL